MATINLALLGGETALGQALLEVIADSPLRLPMLYPLTLAEEAGMVTFRGEDYPELEAADFDWQAAPVLVNCVPQAGEVLQAAASAGTLVIDLAGERPAGGKLARGQILALPTPFAQQLATVIAPLAELGPLRGVSATGMLSVSTEGPAGVDELSQQTRALFAQTEQASEVYPKRIAYNLLGGMGEPDADGITAEEAAALALLKKLLPADCLLDVTCVRTPHFFGHGASIALHFAAPVAREAVLGALKAAERVFLLQVPGVAGVAASQDAVGGDKVWVSRVRFSEDGRGVTLWSVADNTRLPALAVLQLLTLVAARTAGT
ncbi:Asd/ArgC dimerization domain-containing protein [Chitiniphilus purpureus]|uniref:Asd/ArgC dimerization domain-containing protein n=1 Tax=Chitiniphilus purpureus TaxID=2981137 RepID=A0ABY6DRS9_9NEIS|nr:Asd/ArgC dimerization domain-containing protein [Chitiniphilus sp. CD1]UXY17074.1 Asd/ArgC dimerization domain-containing protein [Chitiniphilus sp. CD1]